MARQVPRSFELAFADLYRLAYRVAYRILGRPRRGRGHRPGDAGSGHAALGQAARTPRRLGEPGGLQPGHRPLPAPASRARFPTGPVGMVDDRTAERGDLVAALRRLPRRQREVVVLRYLADFSEADVAAALGCSVGSVKTHASRGCPRCDDNSAVTRHGWGRCSSILTIPTDCSPGAASWRASCTGPMRIRIRRRWTACGGDMLRSAGRFGGVFSRPAFGPAASSDVRPTSSTA